MFNRNDKRSELRAALTSGDPYAIAKVFKILSVSPNKSPSEPNPSSSKETLTQNGVDFTNVAKLLVETNEYASHVRSCIHFMQHHNATRVSLVHCSPSFDKKNAGLCCEKL